MGNQQDSTKEIQKQIDLMSSMKKSASSPSFLTQQIFQNTFEMKKQSLAAQLLLHHHKLKKNRKDQQAQEIVKNLPAKFLKSEEYKKALQKAKKKYVQSKKCLKHDVNRSPEFLKKDQSFAVNTILSQIDLDDVEEKEKKLNRQTKENKHLQLDLQSNSQIITPAISRRSYQHVDIKIPFQRNKLAPSKSFKFLKDTLPPKSIIKKKPIKQQMGELSKQQTNITSSLSRVSFNLDEDKTIESSISQGSHYQRRAGQQKQEYEDDRNFIS